MNRKMSARARIATLALSGLVASGFAATSSAQAQAWFELRTWPGPRYYEEAPPPFFDEAPPRYYREAPPRYRQGARADVLPRNVVRRIVERRGFEVVGPIRLTGDVYIVPVEDMRGRVRRLVVDAREGEIVDRSGPGGPPRPPAGVGRYNERPYSDRFATAPEPLPPLPFDPRGWNEDEYDGPVPPPPPRKPAERKAGERAKQKPAAKQQAARTPPAAKAETAKPEPPKPEVARPEPPVKPEAVKPEVAKPEPAKPATQEAKPESKPESKPEPKQAAPAKPQPDGAKAAQEKQQAKQQGAAQEAARNKTTDEKPEPKRDEAKGADGESRNASILRRPAQKDDDGDPAKRGNVAEGPTVSTGAEPQRKAPRVVYPGPGASITEQTPATSGD